MKKLSLNVKFLLITGGLSASCFGTAYLGLSGMVSVEKDLNEIVEVDLQRKDLWTTSKLISMSLALKEREFYTAKDPTARANVGARLEESKKVMEDTFAQLDRLSTDSSRQKLVEAKKLFSDWMTADAEIRNLGNAGNIDGAREVFIKSQPDRDGMYNAASEMAIANEKALHDAFVASHESFASSRSFILIVSMLTSGLGMVFSFFMVRQIRRAIDDVVKGLSQNSSQVESASQQVATSATQLSQATTEQAASLQETAASAQELTSMVQRNMENAQRASASSTMSQDSAVKGKQVVDELTQAITEIHQSNEDIMNAVNDSNRQVSEITRVISEIGNKTKVINDIVFQTKLLSFNASVEAARAGEHGKGFAVVAEEVGNLARMSGTAAKEISEMLDSSVRKVDAIVMQTKTTVETLVDTGRRKVEAGNRVAQTCAGVLDEIVRNVRDVTRMSNDIANASQEQAQGVHEISRAMSQLDQVTQSNAASAHEAASAAEHLASQAQSLRTAISRLHDVVNGGQLAGQRDETSFAPARPVGQTSNVVELRPEKKAESVAVSAKAPAADAPKASTAAPASADAASQPLKLAAGSEVAIPAEDDPRFKDV